MILSPVFRAELIRTARGKSLYWLRALYGLLLLLLIAEGYQSLRGRVRGGPTDIGQFALVQFLTFSAAQLGVVLALIPPLVGGAIAGDRRRRTLPDLMASPLSAAEIVLDKLTARTLLLGVFVAAGAPVAGLLGLLGGLAPEYILAAYAVTASSTVFAATLTALVSTVARTERQAVGASYMLMVVWLSSTSLVGALGRLCRLPGSIQAVLNEWAIVFSPMSILQILNETGVRRGRLIGNAVLLLGRRLEWMVGLQLAAGLVMLLAAIALLRPMSRRLDGGGHAPARLATRPLRLRWSARPPCDDEPVYWKERGFARADALTKFLVLPAVVALCVVALLRVWLTNSAVRAFRALAEQGYRTAAVGTRPDLNEQLRSVSTNFIALWLLAVASAAAASVAAERDGRTWLSLIATALDGREILKGKALGALGNLRLFLAPIGLLWLTGLVAGAVHPIGFVAAVATLGVLTWFVAALGLSASLRARTATGAITPTIAVLIALNFGPSLLLDPVLERAGATPWRFPPNPRIETLFALNDAVYTPNLPGRALLSFADVAILGGEPWPSIISYAHYARPFAVSLVVIVLYAVAAAILTRRLVRQFDAIVGRPRASGRRRQPEPLVQHQVDDHPGDRDVQPDRQRHAGDAGMVAEAPAQSAG